MKQSSTFGGRIREALARLGWSENDFVEHVAVNPRTAKRYLEREEAPGSGRSRPTLRSVADSLGVTVKWLEKGEGEMLAPRGNGLRVAEPTSGYDTEEPTPPEGEAGDLPLRESENATGEEIERAGYARIEHVSVEAQAGVGSPVHWEKIDGSTLVPVQWARDQYGAHPDRVKRIRVTGNSMVPTIPPGSHIHIVILNADQEPVDGSIYILRGPYGLMVKRIKIENSFEKDEDGNEIGKRYVWLWSDNEEAGRDRLPEHVFRHDYEPVALVRRIEASL